MRNSDSNQHQGSLPSAATITPAFFATFQEALAVIGLLPPFRHVVPLTDKQSRNNGYRVVCLAKGYAIQLGRCGELYAGPMPEAHAITQQ